MRGSVLLLVSAALLAACHEKPAPPATARPVLVVHPAPARDAATASYAGEVRARRETALAFRVPGNVVERRAEVGDHVRAGQVLAVLDATDLGAQARAAQAQLAAADAQLARARADQARLATLGRQQLVSRSAVEAQNAAVAAAQGEANAARAQAQVTRNQAAYTRLLAPGDGVIAARSIEAGQVVAAGQPAFVLAQDGPREVAFAVAESAAASVRPGQAVQVELWSKPGTRWPGRVREVAPAADAASRTFAVRVTVDAPADAIGLGQSARVHLSGDAREALSVPLAAVLRGADGAAVFVADANGTVRLQPVRLGAFGEDRVAVADGLKAGDWVVAAGGHLLQPGQKVSPVDRDNRPVGR